jgi:Ala-tRNA(Pro) deacylase
MSDMPAPPVTPAELLEYLRGLGIRCPTITHPPLRTVSDSRRHREVFDGAYTKNLFLRNKRGHMWLLTLSEDRNIVLKETAKRLGAGNFSFASEERLARHLGIVPGAVSPLALINDREGLVRFAIDRAIVEHERVHFHPLDNTMTTTLQTGDFLRFLALTGHEPVYL